MEENPSKPRHKRALSEDEDEDDEPKQKKPRFPKGKKVKKVGDEVSASSNGGAGEVPGCMLDPDAAAKLRARRRREQLGEEELGVRRRKEQFREEDLDVDPLVEVDYKDNSNFDDDGIMIEPFNLNQEREEGYFDEAGNFVEYVNNKKIKDAWLDSVDIEPKFIEKTPEVTKEEEYRELSSEDIGRMKRRIADVLLPGESVLQALRRIKSASSNEKGRMPEETKRLFDQLTEDSMKLMDNGEYNVYHEAREIFEREAEGYEAIARVKMGTITNSGSANDKVSVDEDIFSDDKAKGTELDAALDPLKATTSSTYAASEAHSDGFDMFGDDDDNVPTVTELSLQSTSENLQPSSSIDSEKALGGDSESDYVYDETSGYYYSSSLGYYYDPNSGLYCSATTGTWYFFNSENGTYDEVSEQQQTAN
ncbi:hypothetical protein QJS04_geneDACA021204 [Acorus gramineus]|uniref:OCRE domain-containing protein n=1 Tax=Acorus gramineus TaxID=55184 RepID=A0AAV9AFN5_ACOGR|nr:hypothetical protein QJS04_geneDACA021204 [Acorus gramineus]